MLNAIFAASNSYSMSSYGSGDWTDAKQGEVWKCLIPLFAQFDQDYAPREACMLRNLQLYTQTAHTNVMAAFRMFDRRALDSDVMSKLVWNITKSAADTIAAKISKNKLKVQLLTDGSDWSLHRKTERLERATYAIMHNNGWHKAAKVAFMDALLCGTGIIQVVPNVANKSVSYERVLPFECYVDELDALYGKPSRYYRWKVMPRRALLKLFPKHEEAISNLPGMSTIAGARVHDAVLVFEAWSLGERHVISAEGIDLLDEEYGNQEPLITIRWSRPGIGFWGVALADELAPFQLEINKVIYYVQRAMQLGHAPKWFVQPNSIPKGYLNNNIGTIIPVNGSMPQYFAPMPIHNQVIEWVQLLKNEAYSLVGISQLSSRSEKPAGLNSGKALQTYNDIESERFVLAGQAYEEFGVEAFKHTVRACQEIADVDPSFNVLASGTFGTEKIDWKDVMVTENQFQVKAYPTSALPQEPAARFAFLQEQLNAGLITPEEFADLNDMPDFRTANQLKYASYYAAKDNVERCLEGRGIVRPEKYGNLTLELSVVTNSYLYCRTRGVPEDRLSRLRDYMDELEVLIEEIKQQQTPPAAIAEAPEGGGPALGV